MIKARALEGLELAAAPERPAGEADPAPEPFRKPEENPPPPPKTGRVLGHRPPLREESPFPSAGPAVRIPTGEGPPPAKEEASPPAPSPPPPPPVDEQILEEARRKAAQIVAEAQAEARRLLEETRLHGGLARRQAHQEGFEEGRQAGLEAARREYQERFQQVLDLYHQVIRERNKLLESAEPELARLAIQVAERIIGQEVRTNAEIVMGVVRNALSHIKDREEILIKVSPQDYHIVNEDRTLFEKMVEGLKNFEVVVDPRVERGGCIIETNLGNVDARLSTQLTAIQAAFDRVDAEQRRESGDGEDAVPQEDGHEPA